MGNFKIKFLLRFVLGFIFTIHFGALSASIQPISDGVKVSTSLSSGEDVLHIAPPNAHGISVNRFSEFYVSGRQLNIINAPRRIRNNSGELEVTAASLIVFIADSIDLNHTIRIIGQPTDLLFLTGSPNGRIDCLRCRFENVLRGSLVAGTPRAPIDVTTAVIGEIDTDYLGRVSVESFTGPGMLSLDIVGHQLSISQSIDINQRALKTYTGAYKMSANGPFVIGAGSVNLLRGLMQWDFEQNSIVSIDPNNPQNLQNTTFYGSIKAGAVKISVVGNLAINNSIDTNTDLLASTSYRGEAHIPDESIDIATLGNGNLVVNGALESSGKVNLRSTGNIYLDVGSNHIEAGKVSVIAQNAITNHKFISGTHINLAGDIVRNEGALIADQEIQVWARRQLANQYGGLIKAEIVRLQSETQFVLNGSRTAYEEDINALSSLNPNSLTGDGSENGSTFYSLPTRPSVNYNPYLSSGSYSGNFDPDNDASAHIVAKRLHIKGVGFENINPYYVKADEPKRTITFDPELSNRVTISVDDYMGVSTDYFVNSSARIVLNNPEGQFVAHTGVFTNERYRTVNGFVGGCVNVASRYQSQCVSGEHPPLYLSSKVIGNSPPGVIAIFGHQHITTTDGIVNDNAYMEVYGNAEFFSPILHVIGSRNELISVDVETRAVYSTEKWCLKTSPVRVVICKGYGTSGPSEIVIEGLTAKSSSFERDSLFLVHGTMLASADTKWINHSPLDEVIAQVIDRLAAENSGPVKTSVQEAKDTGVIEVGSKVFYLFQELKDMFYEFSTAISDFFAELDWWGE